MEVLPWIAQHWLDLLQSVGIVAGLCFTAHTIRTDARSRRIGNLIAFAQHKHDLWKQMYEHPELVRVFDPEADPSLTPVTHRERLFVEQLILHLGSVHRTMKEGMFVTLEGLQTDIRMSVARPVFRTVWEESKQFQDADFVEFVDSLITSPRS
jgi:hypothetical protein